ncbi:MAG: hypothetical protein RR942_03930 [Romboutsia sp.]
MKKRKTIFIFCTLAVILTASVLGTVYMTKPKKEDKEVLFQANKIALFSIDIAKKKVAIDKTPTTGNWTLASDCKGMTISWDNAKYKLNITDITMETVTSPATCKLTFTEKK